MEKRRENHQYPGRSLVTYVRYADNFILLLSGTHQQALEYKEKLSLYIENILNLTIKAHLTNTRKGYKFLGHVFITPRGGVRQPVIRADIPKVFKSLSIKGFCNTQGFPVEHTGYIAITQGETNRIMNTILNEYKEWLFFATNRRRALNVVKYVIIFSIAKTYAAKFDLKTVRKVFSIAGKGLNKPLKTDQRRRLGLTEHIYKAKILPPIRINDYSTNKLEGVGYGELASRSNNLRKLKGAYDGIGIIKTRPSILLPSMRSSSPLIISTK